MMKSLRVEDLKKYYGEVKAVDGISFEVLSGSIFGMLGPNGAGKTTTIETIIGLLDKTEGYIEVLGLDPTKDSTELKQKIGVQLQNPSLFPRLTVAETLDLFASFYPDPLEPQEALERVELEESSNVQVESLSGGQKHRLAVALSMVSDGELIFLDEPTTGLDPKARRGLWGVIENLKEEGVTVFMTTHYMDEAEELCDDLVIIDRGSIIAQGSPKNLINKYFKRRAIDLVDPGFSTAEISKIKDEMDNHVEHKDDRFIIYSENIPETFSQLMSFANRRDMQLDDVVVRRATLEDVFLKLTGRGIEDE